MRLIDADALLNSMCCLDGETQCDAEDCIRYKERKYIEEAPTIDAEPVKHGRWIEHGGGVVATCSNCNASYIKDVLQSLSPYAEHLTRFCPNCGEPMDALKTCCCISDEEAKRILGGERRCRNVTENA